MKRTEPTYETSCGDVTYFPDPADSGADIDESEAGTCFIGDDTKVHALPKSTRVTTSSSRVMLRKICTARNEHAMAPLSLLVFSIGILPHLISEKQICRV